MTYKSPFIVREHIGIPGDNVSWVAVNDETGITTGGYNSREIAASHAQALNAAYELGRNHESHYAGRIVRAARAVNDDRASLAYWLELADALECDERPMLGDTEPRRLTDDELGGRAALEAAGLEPVDGWDDERKRP